MAEETILNPATSLESAPEPAGKSMEEQQEEAKVLERANGHLTRMLHFRRQYDIRRSEMYRQYIGHRQQQLYPDNVTPRSNTFVPYPLSNVETVVSRVMDAFFSHNPWFEARPRGAEDGEAARNMELLLHWQFRKAKFVNEFEMFVRNVCIYGHAGIKVEYDHGTERINYVEPIPLIDPNTGQPAVDPNTGQPIIMGYRPAVKDVPKSIPRFHAIDAFDLMVDPDSALVAHVVDKTFKEILEEAEALGYNPKSVEELGRRLGEEKNPQDVIIRVAELWDEKNGTVTMITFGKDKEALHYKDLRYSYRNGSYTTWRRKIYGGPPILLKHGKNPYLHGKAPILHTSFIKLPNHVFGLGLIEIISDLTEGLNKFVNMITDNWNLGINRRYAYDITREVDQEALNNMNVPGGKVGVEGDPDNVIKELPIFTPSPGDYDILPLYKSMIELSSGVSDFYSKGVGSPSGNRTATGINQVIEEGNFRFRMFIRNLELDVLQPMLEQCASMVQQFMTDEIEVAVTDEAPAIAKYPLIKPEDIVGNMSFEMVAANYATNKHVRQRNMLALTNVITQSPFMNEYEVLKELFKVFEIRNGHRLLKTPEQVAQEQQAQLEQQIQMMIFQAMLESDVQNKLNFNKLKIAQKDAGEKSKKDGRPRTAQFEGQLPGAGISSAVREMAQNMGANATGLTNLSGK